MSQSKNSFKHESLQDKKSIQNILKAITKGIASGQVVFNDDEGEISMHPHGLLTLKVSARKEDNQNQLDIRIRWQSEDQEIKQKPLQVSAEKKSSVRKDSVKKPVVKAG